jgi:hypothetical protein
MTKQKFKVATAAELQSEYEAALRRRSERMTDQGILAVENFYAYMPMYNYIYAPTRASSVNARIAPVKGADGKAIPANAWIDKNRSVEQLSWIPGESMLIKDRLISEGGWIKEKGNTVFNLYRAPTIAAGDPAKAGQWIDHIELIYPDDARHIIRWLAHRVQQPGEKINHALVLGGPPGVGKDTLLEPVKRAVGPWNFTEVSPAHMLGRFNDYVKSVVLRISEARDLGDVM